MATQNIDMAKGADAGGPVTKARFVKLTGDQLAVQCNVAGEAAYGVSIYSCSAAEILKGKGLSILIDGRAIVELGPGGAISAGDLVTTDANGMAAPASSGDVIAGMCDEGGTNPGDQISVDLAQGFATAP